jgi:polyisoprenoid-binding protein YceI
MASINDLPAGTWAIDPTHSEVGFVARHLMVSKVRGSFTDVAGTVHVKDQVTESVADVTIKTDSVATGSADRDGHLRSADFFDVETYPEITFVSTRVEEVEEGAFVVAGELTIRDITQELSIPISLTGVETDAFGALRAGFEGSRRVNRRDFGLEWNMPLDSGGVLVSEKINLEFEISAIRRTEGDAE